MPTSTLWFKQVETEASCESSYLYHIHAMTPNDCTKRGPLLMLMQVAGRGSQQMGWREGFQDHHYLWLHKIYCAQ